MPGRISGAGVVLGVGTTSVVFLALFFRLGAPLYPIMFVEGLVVGTPAWYAHAVLATLPVLASWLLTFFLGGVVAGRMAGAYPGLNGAMCAAVAMLGIFALSWRPRPTGSGTRSATLATRRHAPRAWAS